MRNNGLITEDKINPLCQFNVSPKFLECSKIENTKDENQEYNPLIGNKKPKTNFLDGISDTFKWYLSNKKYYN